MCDSRRGLQLKEQFFTQTVFSVSSEIVPILVTPFLGNEWWNVGKKKTKTFDSLSKDSEEKEREKKKNKNKKKKK